MSRSSPPTMLDAALARVLTRIVAGWRPDAAEIALPRSLKCGETDLTPYVRRLATNDRTLEIHLKIPRTEPSAELLVYGMLKSLRNGAATGELHDGAQFHARLIHFTRGGGVRDGHVNAVLEGIDWRVTGRGAVPRFWITPVQSEWSEHAFGNLTVDRADRVDIDAGESHELWTPTYGHYYLVGRFRYALIMRQSDQTTYLVVDTLGAAPTSDELRADLLAMQFAFGRRIGVGTLVGIDESFNVRARLNLGVGHEPSARADDYPPVPYVLAPVAWVATLFARLSAAMRKHEKLRLHVPLAFYLDALEDHIDGSYLKLHVALEAFAFGLLRRAERDKTRLVHDSDAWVQWVEAHRPEIVSHAADGCDDDLAANVAGARYLSSGKVVDRAFANHDLIVTDAMRAELKGRNLMVHQAALVRDDQVVVDRELERVALVRTMLVALVARAVEYRGAIQGWSKEGRVGDHYAPADPTWWPVDHNAEFAAAETFHAPFAVETDTGTS